MVDPRIVMQPNVGSDRSWVWTAYDYADGDLREEVFALKFGKPQDAEEFKKAFDEAKKAMKAFVPGMFCVLFHLPSFRILTHIISTFIIYLYSGRGASNGRRCGCCRGRCGCTQQPEDQQGQGRGGRKLTAEAQACRGEGLRDERKGNF